MQRSDIRAVGDLAGEASSVLTTLVRGMHAGISSRVFDSIGPSATPTRTIHDGLTRAIYSGVDRGIRGAAHVAGIVAAEVWGNEADEALESRSDATVAVIAAVNGIYGDVLTEQESPLAGAMTIRCGDKPVALTTEALAEAYPAATNRVAVFVHGWCLTEQSWSRRPVEAEDGRSYGERLRDDLGYSPVFLRYNTGLHVSASAVSRVVCLGSPHLGADLEKGVNIASWALARLPETRAIATFLNARSDGVKDLRFGACLDEDWRDADPDEFLRDRCHEAPFLPHARYHFVSSTVTPTLLGLIAGDHLVRPKSAAGLGKSRRIPFEPELGLTLTGLNHFDLMNHPLVYAKLHDWLAHSPVRSAGVSDTGSDVSGDG
jgi:hypothetical protein